MSSPYCILLCSCPDQEIAKSIAQQLIILKQAACINILPGILSIYAWQGEIEHANEHLLLIKTRKDKYQLIEETITTMHPYELPEIISVPIENGLTTYLQWVDQSLNQ